MARADIEVKVKDADDTEEGYLRFDPGSEITGTIHVFPKEQIDARRILLRLEWHTEGRGNRNGAKVGRKELAQGDLSPGMPVGVDFQLTLPQEPWSFAGHYINIIWELHVVVDIPNARNIVHRQRFILRPG